MNTLRGEVETSNATAARGVRKVQGGGEIGVRAAGVLVGGKGRTAETQVWEEAGRRSVSHSVSLHSVVPHHSEEGGTALPCGVGRFHF